MLLALILSSLIQTQTIKLERINGNTKLASYVSRIDSNSHISNDYPAFRLGDSLEQREEETRRLAAETVYKASQRLYTNDVGVQGSSREVEVIGTFNVKGGCVPYAWSQGMQTRGYHIAKNYPVQQTPTQFASTYEGNLGHIVVVEQDIGDKLVVRDANYKFGKITRRIISKSLVKGYVI